MCELCNLEQKTHWYYSNGDWVICDCATCKTPMVVYRKHAMNVSLSELMQILRVIRGKFGNAKLRMNQRKIDDHFHLHIDEN